MSTRIFFYGLYMDVDLLRGLGFRPRQVGAARLDGYRITIGERATLVPARGRSSYGLLHELAQAEVSALYSRPEVVGYVAQPVTVTLLEDSSMQQADCYVLRAAETDSRTNVEYATRLAALVRRLGLPSEYANEIQALVDRN